MESDEIKELRELPSDAQLTLLKQMLEIIDKSNVPEEFMLNCAIQGYHVISTPEFFDNVLFPFLFDDRPYHKEWLKAKLVLKTKLKILNEIYQHLNV